MATGSSPRATRPRPPAPEPALSPDVESRLLALATEVLGGEALARRWIDAPILALGGLSPRVAAARRGGVRRVEDVLGRIAYGGYS